jgi:hypothetical protein
MNIHKIMIATSKNTNFLCSQLDPLARKIKKNHLDIQSHHNLFIPNLSHKFQKNNFGHKHSRTYFTLIVNTCVKEEEQQT